MKKDNAKIIMSLIELYEPEMMLRVKDVEFSMGSILYNCEAHVYLRIHDMSGNLLYSFEGTEAIFDNAKVMIYNDLLKMEV